MLMLTLRLRLTLTLTLTVAVPVWSAITTVTLVSPSNNAVNQPIDSLTFRWQRAFDQTMQPLGHSSGEIDGPETISKYWFELASDSIFASVVVIDSTLTDTAKTVVIRMCMLL